MRLAVLALAACACGAPADTQAPEDTGPDPCTVDPAGTLLTSGTYTLGIDEVASNGCENDVGNGLHIHVGETTEVAISRAGRCLDATSDPGSEMAMPMTGSTDGEGFDLAGDVPLEIGTCVLGIHAVLTGVLSSETAFDYRMDATLSVQEELSPDACSYLVGDGEEHTFPELPCSQAWTGTGVNADQ